jgi:hypothetical protein
MLEKLWKKSPDKDAIMIVNRTNKLKALLKKAQEKNG